MAAILFSWNASAIFISSLPSPARILPLSSPTVGTPIMSIHIWYSWNMSNILSSCTDEDTSSGSSCRGRAT